MASQYGATPEAWNHWDMVLGLTDDLLPVVSDPTSVISPFSKMRDLGKTPSKFNGAGEVVGLTAWTTHHTKPKDIERYQREPRYGICLQTRNARAIDIDIPDPALAAEAEALVARTLGFALPVRTRANTGKRLLLLSCPGIQLPKRVIRCGAAGIIEMLGNGQQAVIEGTHPSGVRYEWLPERPDVLPELSLAQVDRVWAALESRFATEASTPSKASTKQATLTNTLVNDPIAKHLRDEGFVLGQERDGRLHIRCPWESEHSVDTGPSSTTYFPANTGGYANGHFHCLHAHCEGRTDEEFKNEIGAPSDYDLFDVVSKPTPTATQPAFRFNVIPAHEFSQGSPPRWIIKNVLPQAALAVMFGDSGSGKSFKALDMCAAVARGQPWRGKRVHQGKVVYICAEGAGGFRNRLRAYAHHNALDLADLDIGVIGDAPNFMQPAEIKEVLAALHRFGEVSLIVVDTFAQVMPGANENAGEDVGKALAHCRALHKHTGALVLLIHHSGKDATRGARGWSGLRAAADAEIEVCRDGDHREMSITKLKDGGDGDTFAFKLLSVPIDIDEDGDEISSCVVEHGEAQVKRIVKKTRWNGKGHNERIVLECLQELQGLGQEGVRYTALVEAACAQLPYDPNTEKRDTRGQRVKKAVESLQDAGGVKVEKGFILVVKNNEEVK